MKEKKFSNVSVLYHQSDLGPSNKKRLKILGISVGFLALYSLLLWLALNYSFLIVFALIIALGVHNYIICCVKETYENVSQYSEFLYDITHREIVSAVGDGRRPVFIIKENGEDKKISLNDFCKGISNMKIISDFPLENENIFVTINCLDEKMVVIARALEGNE